MFQKDKNVGNVPRPVALVQWGRQVSSLNFICCLVMVFVEVRYYEANIRGGGKTVNVVFKYLSRSLLKNGVGAQ